MKKILAMALSICVLTGILSGCLSGPGAYVPTGDGLFDGSITTSPKPTAPPVEQDVALVYYPDEGMNPYTTADATNRALFSLLYQGLFVIDANYTAHAMLCSGYQVSKDLKTYTFFLENATFSNGAPVTAADVVASLQAAKAGPVYSGRLKNVSSISEDEAGAVVIKLTTAYENLPLLLDIPIVSAADVEAEKPLGSGPYYLENSKSGLRLVRRFDWWCSAEVPVSTTFIQLVEATSPAQIRDAFEFSGVSLVCTDPGSDSYVDFRSDHELWECESGLFLYLACNEKSAVFSNQTLRQALTHAIDRAALAENYYGSFATPAYLPASPRSPFYNKVLAAQYGYDSSILPQAVADANLETNEVTLLVHKGDGRRVRAADAIAKVLNEAGLKVTVSKLSGTSYSNALRYGNFDLHLGQTMLSPNMDLTAFYTTGGALCYGGMSNPAILAMCKDALENSGNYETMHRMVMDDAMLCPILFRSYAIYTTRGLFELEPARDQIFFYTRGKTAQDVLMR